MIRILSLTIILSSVLFNAQAWATQNPCQLISTSDVENIAGVKIASATLQDETLCYFHVPNEKIEAITFNITPAHYYDMDDWIKRMEEFQKEQAEKKGIPYQWGSIKEVSGIGERAVYGGMALAMPQSQIIWKKKGFVYAFTCQDLRALGLFKNEPKLREILFNLARKVNQQLGEPFDPPAAQISSNTVSQVAKAEPEPNSQPAFDMCEYLSIEEVRSLLGMTIVRKEMKENSCYFYTTTTKNGETEEEMMLSLSPGPNTATGIEEGKKRANQIYKESFGKYNINVDDAIVDVEGLGDRATWGSLGAWQLIWTIDGKGFTLIAGMQYAFIAKKSNDQVKDILISLAKIVNNKI